MRADLNKVREWIKPNSRVLDLGCGDGMLLQNLQQTRNVTGYGIELDDSKIAHCISNNINVIHADLNQGLSDYFDDQAFDCVIMSQTLQATKRPDQLILEMMRVGRQGIVTFPNHGYWKNRFRLGVAGKMPTTENFAWYNTPNTHLCTLEDFEQFCKDNDIRILEREVVDHSHKHTFLMDWFPNVFGEVAIYRVTKDSL